MGKYEWIILTHLNGLFWWIIQLVSSRLTPMFFFKHYRLAQTWFVFGIKGILALQTLDSAFTEFLPKVSKQIIFQLLKGKCKALSIL